MYGLVIPLIILLERIYAVRNHRNYENVSLTISNTSSTIDIYQEVSPRNCIFAIILGYALAFSLTVGLFKGIMWLESFIIFFIAGFYSKLVYRWIVVFFATCIILVEISRFLWQSVLIQTLVYYTQYTRKHAKRIMEIRFRLMSNNIASRYQIIEAQRSAHILKWYIPYQVNHSHQ